MEAERFIRAVASDSDLRRGYHRAPVPNLHQPATSGIRSRRCRGSTARRRPSIERAEGVWLVDTDGRRYIDGVSSLWCNVHGHRHPDIDAAVREQLDRVAHTTMLGLSHPGAEELAQRLVAIAPGRAQAPGPLSRVFFSDSGSTAVEVALKMAFQYWQQAPDARPSRTRFV